MKAKYDFSKLSRYLERVKEAAKIGDLDKYGRAGVGVKSLLVLWRAYLRLLISSDSV